MICGSCNAKIEAGARFCSSCGETLDEAPAKSEVESPEFSISQWIVIIVIGLTIGVGYGWLDDDSGAQLGETPVASTQQTQKVSDRVYLSELALICRAAEQIPQFLSDLENDRTPDMDDCAINPLREQIHIDIVARRTIGQDQLVHWRKPTTGFEGWTLESNLVFQ